MTTTLLIDADIVVYRAALTSTKTVNWGHDLYTQTADLKQAAQKMDSDIREWMAKFKATDVIVALSDPVRGNNWRRKVLPSYKNNRTNQGKPIIFHQCREHLEQTYRTEQFKGLEGDDVLGLFATGGSKGDRRIMVSSDKDLLNVPGELYNPGHPERDVVQTGPFRAAHNHAVQTLTGDPVDGYKGCPGVGKIGAERLLADAPLEKLWPLIVRRYEKAGLTEDDALVQARVAHILVAGDYNRKTGEVKLWEPARTCSTSREPASTPVQSTAASHPKTGRKRGKRRVESATTRASRRTSSRGRARRSKKTASSS